MDILIDQQRIERRVKELAQEIRDDFADVPFTVVGVLTGSLIFLADLIRQIELPLQIGLVNASSYRGATTVAGTLTIEDSLLPNIQGRSIVMLDDILDTGQTASRLRDHLLELGAKSVKTCVLLRKIGRQSILFEPDYVGFEIPDKFVIGYGLDYNDDYRHLPYIGIYDPQT